MTRLSALFSVSGLCCLVSCTAQPAVSHPVVTIPPTASSLAAPSTRATPDVYLEMPRLLAALNAARAQRGAAPLAIDRGLALVAQQANARYQRLVRGQAQCVASEAGRELAQRVASEANRELASFSLTFSSVQAIVVCVDRLEQAISALQDGLDPAMRFAGLALAPASDSAAGFAVVLTLGR